MESSLLDYFFLFFHHSLRHRTLLAINTNQVHITFMHNLTSSTRAFEQSFSVATNLITVLVL